ncbi:MAG: nickel insertion protein, partial [Pyrinomonadaceae bacterium]
TMVSILCAAEKRKVLTELLYTETSTLGVRVSGVVRNCLPREIVKVETEFGEIEVKVARFNGKIVNAKPEYEQIRKIALQSKTSLREVEKEVLKKLK